MAASSPPRNPWNPSTVRWSVRKGASSAIAIAGDQLRSIGIGSRDQDRRNVENIRSEARCDELLDRFPRRHQNLAAHVSAFLGRGQLIFKMNGGRAGFDHALHQFKCVQNSAEACFRVRHDRQHPVDRVMTVGMGNLVGSHQRVVDGAHHVRNAVCGIETLVGIHLPAQIRIRRHLPAAQIDGFQPGLGHLYSLVSCQGAKCRNVFLLVKQPPKLFCSCPSERMLHSHCSPKMSHVMFTVGADHSHPNEAHPMLLLKSFCSSSSPSDRAGWIANRFDDVSRPESKSKHKTH